MELLREPLLRAAIMALWLLPCAIQDWRCRRVSNWLTVPLFVAAWPTAAFLGNLPLTVATFIGTYVAWKVRAGFGGADGKIAVGLAAFAPPALIMGFALQACALLVRRRLARDATSIPGVSWFWVAACCFLIGTAVGVSR